MTAAEISVPHSRKAHGSIGRGYPLVGTWSLLRFMLRRDRVRSTLWVMGIGLMGFYVANAVQIVAETQADLAEIAFLFTDPVGRLMSGPAYGMDEPTYERFYAAGYVLFLYIGLALMSIFTVIRHTRAEEQTGRAELIRAAVVGRHATLTSALLMVLINTVLSSVLLLAGALMGGFALEGSLLVAVTGTAVALFFAAAAAFTAQLSQSSRLAAALAGGLLGFAYLIRMGGDMAEQGGTALSWFSPLGWAQQTAPYVLDRWWPVLLLLGAAVPMAWLGYWLSARRDLDAGLIPDRLGRAQAPSLLATPMGMAARTLGGGLRGWSIALLLGALLFGGYAHALTDAAENLPAEFTVLFGEDSMMLGYLAYITTFLAMFAAAAGISGLTQLRGEETRGRAEFSLSLPISRITWLGAHLTVLLVGLVLMLLLIGAGTGISLVAVLEEGGSEYLGDLVLASLHQFPAVLAVVGLVVALFGWLPRAAGPVGWVIISYALFMTNFGQLLDLHQRFHDLNLFSHLAQYPVEDILWAPVLVLTGIGLCGIVLGLLGWKYREVNRV